MNAGTGEYRIRKAGPDDIAAVAMIYEQIHDQEEAGAAVIGWARGVYPTEKTAKDALARDDLYVLETEDTGAANAAVIAGAAVINQAQVDCYAGGRWSEDVPDDQVMVLHTLVVSPAYGGKGIGRAFVSFYEALAAGKGCRWLRMDTNAKNARARAMYRTLGYTEIGTVPTTFNGIEGVQLVLLEKACPENNSGAD